MLGQLGHHLVSLAWATTAWGMVQRPNIARSLKQNITWCGRTGGTHWLGSARFVFQNFQLLPALTALENVRLPLEMSNQYSLKQCKKLAEQWLDKVGLSQRVQHYPTQLSGGEQQRVAIARAFACEPNVLFADEPTGNLDRNTGKQIIDLLFELNQQNRTSLILVTHDDHLAQRCQRSLQIHDGVVLKDVQRVEDEQKEKGAINEQ